MTRAAETLDERSLPPSEALELRLLPKYSTSTMFFSLLKSGAGTSHTEQAGQLEI